MPNAGLPLSRLTSRWPALAYPAYRRMMAVRFATTFGIQVQLVAVGWQVYDLSREPLYLGLIGLVQFVPAVALILVTGTVADRFQRRIVVAICLLIMVGCALVLMAVTLAGERDVWPFLALMGAVGVARAFLNPALQACVLSWARHRRLIAENPASGEGNGYTRARGLIWYGPTAMRQRSSPLLRSTYICRCCAVWTGQRQGDLLRLTWSAYDARRFACGRRRAGGGSPAVSRS